MKNFYYHLNTVFFAITIINNKIKLRPKFTLWNSFNNNIYMFKIKNVKVKDLIRRSPESINQYLISFKKICIKKLIILQLNIIIT